ncbi:MAG: TRAM domain-containing protein, partial [Planctomycetota bacterium]|nr:TRAM domain-containing protein [Planctomycetota bacterium]
GRTVPVFVEGPSPHPHLDGMAGEGTPLPLRSGVQLRGRTPTGRIVVFDGPTDLAGEIVDVQITRAAAVTLFGERCDSTGPAG